MNSTKGAFIGFLVVCIAFGIYALIAWGVSVLVSYVFGIDFGFWKSAASLILLSIFASYFRSSNGSSAD